ncbi:hypothetical protein L6164_028943 [Bauhinia variegata]|nr:hypothetical protein L6164_028943 [Bauhinia variegata]
MVNKQPVQVLWDVHDWLFNHSSAGHGLFIFKPGPAEVETEKEGSMQDGFDSDGGSSSGYYSTRSNAPPEFCLFLYCFKLE